MANTIVLITGANRGIGRSILELYLNRPNHTVIAANRDPSHASSQDILSLPRAEGNAVHVIKIDATVPTDAAAGARQLAALGINHLNIVIANAAVAYQWPKVVDVKIDDIQKHIVPNVYGFLGLWQAMWPLLKAAESPRWVTIGSSAACLTEHDSVL
ncbi:norsolorinic acid reductase-like protein [Xylariales sp. PMI_506]|nr:norsolorinic acid reductase-like protein [Xylariales sp. PMI_506]